MAYISANQLAAYVSAQMRLVSTDDLVFDTDEVITPALSFAHAEITQRLLARGYRQADIDAWDRRVEFTKDLGAWKCFVNVANPDGDTTWVDKYDRRDELDSITLLVDGEIVDIVTDNASIRTGQNTYDRQTRESFGGPDAVDYAGGAGWQ